MKSQVSVIIPTYSNVSGLNYLLNYFEDKPYQFIVIDNNPKVRKFESLKVKKFRNLVYLPQKKNLGFAGAVNLGAKYVKSKWTVILNDDIVFKIQNSK